VTKTKTKRTPNHVPGNATEADLLEIKRLTTKLKLKTGVRAGACKGQGGCKVT
jgi:hypothetical protein